MAIWADPKDISEVLSGMDDLLSSFKPEGEGLDALKTAIKNFFLKLYTKIVAWIRFTIWVEIAFIIVFLFHCAKPDGGRGTCILAEDSGLNNTKVINMKEFFATGATPNENNYSSGGQRTNWFDTGFVTDGKPLIVYASGDYYPWGKKQTERITGYHTGIAKVEDGEFETKLQITDDYQECEFNTDIRFQNDDDENTRIVYANQLTRYTGQNKNNREGGYSYALAQLGSQFDCIVGNNCFGNRIVKTDDIVQVDYPTGCVLRNGAGIYMRIGGNDVKYAYHIKNTYVPLLERKCLLDNDGLCEWIYKDKTTLSSVNVAQVPFGLPIQIYNQEKQNFVILEDVRSNLIKNLTPITEYQWKEKQLAYQFTTLEKVAGISGSCEKNDLTDATKYQTINDICYQSITREMTNEELVNHSCQSFSTDLLHPDELCPPPKGKRIWIKPADTFYEDDEGLITLLFASGAKNENGEKSVSYAKNGFKLSWIQNILYTLIEPLWGEQNEKTPTIDLIERENKLDGTIEICHKNNKPLYYSLYKGNYIIKTAKYATTGMIMQMADETISTSSLYNIKYSSKITDKKDCLTLKSRDSNNIPDYRNVNQKMHDGVVTWLIQIDNIQDGLFFQVRDAILKSGHFNMARILIALWFVFAFAIGFFNKKKIITFEGSESILPDWKHFLICMWATDYHNYAFIDELLWPSFFYGAESLATILFEAGSNIFGSSLNPDNPYEYFDNIINMITSKELIYKLMAIGTNFDGIIFSLFFLYFPLCFMTCVELFKAVMVPISMVCLTVFGVGQVMMLMPVYALASFFKSQKDVLKKTMQQLVKEFVHFALELGFFGIFIGIVYGRFLKSLNFKVCWDIQIDDYKLLYVFPLTFENWLIKDEHQSLKGMWSLIKTMAGCFGLSFIAKYACSIATFLADKICASGGLGLGLRQASVYGNMAGDILNKTIQGITNTLSGIKNGIKNIFSGNSGINTGIGIGGGYGSVSGNRSDDNAYTMPRGNGISNTAPIPYTANGVSSSNTYQTNGISPSNTYQTNGGTGNSTNISTKNIENDAQSAITEAKRLLSMNGKGLSTGGGRTGGGPSKGGISGSGLPTGTRKRRPSKSQNLPGRDFLDRYRKSLEEKKEEPKPKPEPEVNRGAGIQGGFEGIKESDAGMKGGFEGLRESKSAGLKNPIFGEEPDKQKEEQMKKEKEQKIEEDRKQKEEKLKKQQELIDDIEKEKKIKKEAEEKAKQEIIKKELEQTKKLEEMKKAEEDKRKQEEQERIERQKQEEEAKRQAALAQQQAEEDKRKQEMIMKAAQKMEKKPQQTKSKYGYVQDKWSALSSGKSVWQKKDLKTHYLDKKQVWHKKK